MSESSPALATRLQQTWRDTISGLLGPRAALDEVLGHCQVMSGSCSC